MGVALAGRTLRFFSPMNMNCAAPLESGAAHIIRTPRGTEEIQPTPQERGAGLAEGEHCNILWQGYRGSATAARDQIG